MGRAGSRRQAGAAAGAAVRTLLLAVAVPIVPALQLELALHPRAVQAAV